MPYKHVKEYVNGDGYIMVHSPNHPFKNKRGYVQQHRLMMENHLGRYLERTEEIHHKNRIRHDNRLDNLLLCKTKHDHMVLHREPPCRICGEIHHAKGLCQKHYNESVQKSDRYTVPCSGCGKLIKSRCYTPKDGLLKCRRCRFPLKKCKVCGAPAEAKELCKNHYQSVIMGVPCSKCGKKIRKGGRNHWPPICWNCRFPKQTCKVCAGKHMAHGFCDNHWRQWRRGTMTFEGKRVE